MVTRSSAIIPGYKNIGIHAGHRDMVRFASENDPGFISVAGELRRWLDEIKAATKMDSLDAAPNTGVTTNVGIHAGEISIIGNVTQLSVVGGSQIINGSLIFS